MTEMGGMNLEMERELEGHMSSGLNDDELVRALAEAHVPEDLHVRVEEARVRILPETKLRRTLT